MSDTLADLIDALLPQTQCRQCGYPGCRPYAEAVAAGRTGINQCPPGGTETIHELAALLGRPFEPPPPEFGACKPMAAAIDEAVCIGCTLCIQACPVDAIVGAAKHMHTVITTECTGCELCIPRCPVDCIAMVGTAPATSRMKRAALARRRYSARNMRLEREKAEREAETTASRNDAAERRKRDTIARVMRRARERLGSRSR